MLEYLQGVVWRLLYGEMTMSIWFHVGLMATFIYYVWKNKQLESALRARRYAKPLTPVESQYVALLEQEHEATAKALPLRGTMAPRTPPLDQATIDTPFSQRRKGGA